MVVPAALVASLTFSLIRDLRVPSSGHADGCSSVRGAGDLDAASSGDGSTKICKRALFCGCLVDCGMTGVTEISRMPENIQKFLTIAGELPIH